MPRRSDFPNIWSSMVIAVLLCQWFELIALGQTEAQVASKIRQMGGGSSTDGDGKITAIMLANVTDQQIESIDFSVLPRLQSLTLAVALFRGLKPRDLRSF